MATNVRSWGVLGNPSKEKIEEYAKMPVGHFRDMVKRLSRGKKGKSMREFDVYMVKRKIDATRGVIKVSAFEWSDAMESARLRKDEVTWDEAPYKTGFEEIAIHSMDPLKYS